MRAPLRLLALPLPCLLGGCLAPPIDFCADCTVAAPDTTGDDPTTPTGGEGGVQTVTGDEEASTTTDASSGSSTTAEVEADPAIVSVELDPNPIKKNGMIAVEVEAEHADGVRMELISGNVIDLAPAGAGSYEGQIPAFTGLDNGTHSALLTPWRATLDGEIVDAPYTISLPEPGSQGFWETGDPGGGGHVAALDVLPDGSLVELGTYYEKGEPRCYLRRRDQNGAWFLADFISVLPTSFCTAIDLKIDPELGTLHVLVNRKGGDGLRWWLGEIASWGKGAKQIGLGAVGDKAEALAQRPGLIAVCGGKKTATLDQDAAAWLHRPNEPVETRLFDYWPGQQGIPHRFDEVARDCEFAGNTLVLVGEVNGKHADADDLERDRRLILEHDTTVAKSPTWTVGGAGSGTQSRALAVDVDDKGRYVITGYSCGDACEPDGEVRIHLAGGKLQWQASLGPLATTFAGPHDVAWSPAGYLVVALAQLDGQSLRFKVQAFATDGAEPLWTYLPADMQGLQVALALAIGKFGEIYAGGIGAGNYPAIAYIPG